MNPQRIPNVLISKRSRVAANDDGYGIWRGMVVRLPAPATPGTLVRLPLRTPLDADDSAHVSALDAMTTIEDLWLRLEAHGVLRLVDNDPDRVTVSVAGAESSHVSTQETRELMAAATCASTYRWSEGGFAGSWVERFEQGAETGTVQVHLTSWKSILRWPDGDALVWALQSLVQRLRLGSQP